MTSQFQNISTTIYPSNLTTHHFSPHSFLMGCLSDLRLWKTVSHLGLCTCYSFCQEHSSFQLSYPWPASWAFLVAQRGKCLPTMQETRVQSLGREDPLEKGMTTHSSTFAWKIPCTEKPGRLQSMGSQRVGHDRATSLSLFRGSRNIPISRFSELLRQPEDGIDCVNCAS